MISSDVETPEEAVYQPGRFVHTWFFFVENLRARAWRTLCRFGQGVLCICFNLQRLKVTMSKRRAAREI